jgi:multicomponent Na+:H+ antiporter subunit A
MSLLPVLLPLIPALAAPLVLALHRWRPGAAVAAAVAASLAATVAAALLASPAAAGAPAVLDLAWAAPLGPDLHLRADAWGVLFSLIIAGIGAVVCAYAGSYAHGERSLGALLAHLLGFQAAMLLLAVADDPLLLFTAWELTSFLSYRLVAGTGTPAALAAARDALLVTGLGGLALLIGLLITAGITGSDRISDWGAAAETLRAAPLLVPALLLCVAGCATKSAQFPFHFWLPGAMAAPTPVSTYLHAATMVKAGVFLLARLHAPFGGHAAWEIAVGGMAVATIAAAGFRLWTADDLKRLLALSTVLALGTLCALLALDGHAGVLAAAVLLIAHAGYKATLFLVVGAIDHGAGTRSLAALGGLGRKMPLTATAAALGGASMAGLPLFIGFAAKDQVKLAVHDAGWWVGAALIAASALFVAVAWKVAVQPFWGRAATTAAGHAHDSRGLALPALATAIAGLALGSGGIALLLPLIERTAFDLAGRGDAAHLAFFPSALGKAGAAAGVLIAGIALALAVPWLARGTRWLRERAVESAWRALLDGIAGSGSGLARTLQCGDLRAYAAVLVGTVAVVALWWMHGAPAKAPAWTAPPLWAWSLTLLVAVGALATALARRRIVAVAGLGAVGWAVALFFVGFGAPDVAMTQVLVETLSVLLLVLAFRRLPDFSDDLRASARPRVRASANRVPRAAIAVALGIAAGVAAWLAQGGNLVPPPIAAFMRQAPERGFGGNVVNVIIVDLRALDTLGEIAVLAIAATGAVALLGGSAAPRLDAERVLPRSPILAAATRLLWPLALLFALFLFWRGHHHPGGGFAAGLVAAAGWALVALAHGPARARRVLPLSPGALTLLGLAIAAASGLPGLIRDGVFMAPQWGVLLGVKLGTPMLFDLGVMLLVTGMVVAIIDRLLAADDEERAEDACRS